MTTAPHAVVVGGGLAGLTAAVAVAQAGLDVVHVAPKSPPDRRTSALMLPSVRFLRDAGLIGDPAAIGHPLTQIRIIDATGRLVRAPETVFDSRESGLDAFGWNFPNASLANAFEAARAKLPRLRTLETTLSALVRVASGWRLTLGTGESIQTPVVLGADGRNSTVRSAGSFRTRRHDFREAALVCDLKLGRPLGGASVEFHYPRGPFTLVPAGGDRSNLVWIDDRAALDAARQGGPEALRQALIEKSQRLFGDIALGGPSHVFALSTLSVTPAGADGILLVGEAAHAFPPIGAQGLNLGLRDVADAAAALAATSPGAESWAATASADYAARRAGDLRRTGGVVDALFRSLLADMLPAQMLRSSGMWALKLLPPLRRGAFGLGMGSHRP